MVVNILPADPPSTLGMGLKGQSIFLTESSPVPYQTSKFREFMSPAIIVHLKMTKFKLQKK